MSLDFVKYTREIIEFKTAETLKAIDWGVLELGHINDFELKRIFQRIEKELIWELKRNYRQNQTGIFRVSYFEGIWYYREFECVIKANTLCELKCEVLRQNRIWYVFDEFSVRHFRR